LATRNLYDKHGDLAFARISLNTLSSSTSRAGKYSDLIDMTAVSPVAYPMIEVFAKVKAISTPSANRAAHLFWIGYDDHASDPHADDGATFSDMPGISGDLDLLGDAAITLLNARHIGSLWLGGSTSSGQELHGSFLFPHPGTKGAFALYHDFGVALSSADQELSNGSFSSDTVWVKGSGWAISGGVAAHTATNDEPLSQRDVLTAGKTYRVQYTISGRTAGSISVILGDDGSYSGTGDNVRSADGTYVEDLVAAAGGDLFFVPSSDFDGDIDDVSCVLMEPDPVNYIRWRGVNPQLI
jgi:hypothetical protein